MTREHRFPVVVPDGPVRLSGEWGLPTSPGGVVLFANSSGSARLDPRNQLIAVGLQAAGFATLLVDLLTPAEDADPAARLDIALLARRLIAATQWVRRRRDTRRLRIGYLSAGSGAAAALMAAAALSPQVAAVVSLGGHPELAAQALGQVRAATLFIVGERDARLVEVAHHATRLVRGPCEMMVVQGGSQRFEEPGAFDQVRHLATNWLTHFLAASSVAPAD